MMPPCLRWLAPNSPGRGAPRARSGAALVLVILLLAAAGCSKSNPTPAPTRTRPSTNAKIAIISPTAGATVTGSTLHVVLMLTGATLVPAGTVTGVSPTEGHIHLIDNGSIVSMANGLEQDISVTPGTHILEAEFVANDHASFFPRDLVSVRFVAT